MLTEKPMLGWNSWNTFGDKINEELIIEMTDALVEKGYKDVGYEYVIIDDCWSLRERVDGKITANPKLFPHGMKYLADYIHSKGLKFGMYSCAGIKTCAGYPSSYGYEYEDAKQFAEWGVDYLKYDYCNFPKSANAKNAYLTMAMALRNCGREIAFAACNWGAEDPAKWMRSHGANSYRSTGDIFDTPKSFSDIFKAQALNVEGNAPGCYNDIDMLIVGMHGKGNVGLSGCTDEEYMTHFAAWAFLGSPLIIGSDIRSMDSASEKTLLNKSLISINQDAECRPPFVLTNGEIITMARLLEHGKFAIAMFNLLDAPETGRDMSVVFDDLGIHSNTGKKVRIFDAVAQKDMGIVEGAVWKILKPHTCAVYIGELVNE